MATNSLPLLPHFLSFRATMALRTALMARIRESEELEEGVTCKINIKTFVILLSGIWNHLLCLRTLYHMKKTQRMEALDTVNQTSN